MTTRYKITCSYLGTQYFGWQVQPDSITVQGEINRALAKIVKSKEVNTIGSGRTDRGVHALNQVFSFHSSLDLAEEAFLKGLNSLLPLDIRIKEVEKVSEDFHPIRDAKEKEYLYLFCDQENLSPFERDLVSSYSFPLDFDLIQKALEILKGEHDFKIFQCTGTDVNSTIRTITEIELTPIDPPTRFGHGNYYQLRIRGTGFLKQMVRLIMGALWNIGSGKVSLESLENGLKEDEKRLGPTAPPQGLYLHKVFY